MLIPKEPINLEMRSENGSLGFSVGVVEKWLRHFSTTPTPILKEL